MNNLRAALDRTLLLMRDEVRTETPDAVLMAALTSTDVALVADAATLTSPAAQTAFVTAAMLCARSGHRVHLVAPDITLAAPQPPLSGERLIGALMGADARIMPESRFAVGVPDHHVDLEITLGQTAPLCQARLRFAMIATAWSGSLTQSEATGPWPADLKWPIGAMAAAVLAATEVFKCAMEKLLAFAHEPAMFSEFFQPQSSVTLQLAPEGTRMISEIGMFDVVSGGAITNGTLYALGRLPDVRGAGRIIEPETYEISNLNRYLLLMMDDLDLRKAEHLAQLDMGGLVLKPLPWRFENERSIGTLAPRALVGVDHIPTRWAVQRARPRWLGIGATSHWSAMSSHHRVGEACAGCAHPYDDAIDGPIPTAAVVSFLAALLQTTDFLRDLAGDRGHEQLAYVTLPRSERTWRTPVARHQACPVCKGGQTVVCG